MKTYYVVYDLFYGCEIAAYPAETTDLDKLYEEYPRRTKIILEEDRNVL